MPSLKAVIIPVITGREIEKAFLLEAAGKARKAVLVYLVDQSSGLTVQEMEQDQKDKEDVLTEIENELRLIGKNTKVYNEWGNYAEKLPMIFKKERAGEVVVLKRGRMTENAIAAIRATGLPVREVDAITLSSASGSG